MERELIQEFVIQTTVFDSGQTCLLGDHRFVLEANQADVLIVHFHVVDF